MNQVLFRVGESMELLSNRVLDPFPQGLMGKSMDLLGGLRSTMEGGRELLLCFERAQVRKKRQIDSRWGGRGKVYIPLAPNGHRTQGVGRDGACGLKVR